jgi:hypothetical protein
MNKVMYTGSILDKKPAKKRHMITEEKLDEVETRLEYTPQKSLRRLTKETGFSKSSAAVASVKLKHRPYNSTVVHAL